MGVDTNSARRLDAKMRTNERSVLAASRILPRRPVIVDLSRLPNGLVSVITMRRVVGPAESNML
jgi:hypothetical protein